MAPPCCRHGWANGGVVAAATAAGDADAELVAIAGADHFAHIDPTSEAWAAVLDRLPDHL